MLKKCLLVLLLGFVAGCGRTPMLDQDGGYELTYKAPPEAEHDSATMVRALDDRLRSFRVRNAIVRSEEGGKYVIELPGADEAKLDQVQKIVGSSGHLNLQIVAERGQHDAQIEAAQAVDNSVAEADDKTWRWVHLDADKVKPEPSLVLRSLPDGSQEVLVVTSENDISGSDLKSASMGRDSGLRPCLLAELRGGGTSRMRALTAANLKRKLGIIFDDKLIAAPVVQSEISDRLELTGDFTEDEVQFMIGLLKSGTLPAPLVEDADFVKKVEPR
jgi:preprotein translocase subunit SecD